MSIQKSADVNALNIRNRNETLALIREIADVAQAACAACGRDWRAVEAV